MSEAHPRDVDGEEPVLLFSYGTLRLPAVQTALFGGPVPTEVDAVAGHRLQEVRIQDAEVVRISGAEIHPVLVPSTDPGARVEGVVLTLDASRLAAADAYEVEAYRRVRVPLASGRAAWAYTLAALPES